MNAAALTLDHELAQALRDESFGWQRLRPLLVDAALFALMAALFHDRPAWPLCMGLYFGHALTDNLCGLAGRRLRPALLPVMPGLLFVAWLGGALLGWAVELSQVGDTLAPQQRLTHFWLHLGFVGAMLVLPLWHGVRRQRGLRQLERERALLRAELQTLQAQIEPHFLFNTLATLRSFVRQGSERALPLLDAVTGLLETSLHRLRRPEGSTLGQECQLVEHYLAIMALRLGERLRWFVDVPPDLHDLPLPPLMLQPLVENAIQHGIEPSEVGGEVQLRAERDGGRLRLIVTNSGCPLQPATAPRGHGLALINLRQRLQALHGDKAQLTLATNAAGLTEATLTLPLE